MNKKFVMEKISMPLSFKWPLNKVICIFKGHAAEYILDLGLYEDPFTYCYRCRKYWDGDTR